MRKSKLESFEDILEALLKQPLTFDCISLESDLDTQILKHQLDFLMKNGLVEERQSEKNSLFAITEKGVAVLRALNFQKYLGRIKDTIRAVDEAFQIIPAIVRQEHRTEEKRTKTSSKE